MKHIIALSFLTIFALVLGVNSSAQEKKMEMKKKVENTDQKIKDVKHESDVKVEKTQTKTVDSKPVNKVCPVSGEEVENNITWTYEGKTYALCCKTCLKKFKKDPKKYISRLSEDGNSLNNN